MLKFDREVGTTSIHLFSSCLPRPTHPSQPTAGQPACVNGVREKKIGVKAATVLESSPAFVAKAMPTGWAIRVAKAKATGRTTAVDVMSSTAPPVLVTI